MIGNVTRPPTKATSVSESAIAPGQAAVFYDGDEVLGGGWIEVAR